jgi:lauroyl/myristoyl acyltransferase
VTVTRGIIAALFDYDWRNIALGKSFVRRQTLDSMRIIDAQAHEYTHKIRTLKRFIHNAREEWQAELFHHPIMHTIRDRTVFEGFQQILNVSHKGRGVVLLSSHLDSFCMGMVLMGMHGLPIHIINTAEIENPRIIQEVRDFFQRKYRSMETLMGGRMPYYQSEMHFFYQALRRGESVAIMGDIPGSKSSVVISFLGQKFRMPLGAWLLARETNSIISGFVCLHQGVGRYKVIFCDPVEADEDPECSLRPIYAFLENWIRKCPDRWVSADLLPGYKG